MLIIRVGLVLAQRESPVIATASFEQFSQDDLPGDGAFELNGSSGTELPSTTPQSYRHHGASPSQHHHQSLTPPSRHHTPAGRPAPPPEHHGSVATPGHAAPSTSTPHASRNTFPKHGRHQTMGPFLPAPGTGLDPNMPGASAHGHARALATPGQAGHSQTPPHRQESGIQTSTPHASASGATPRPPGGERHGGSRSWRNNNPGNIEYGAFAREHGASGSDGRFAIFPDEAAGIRAQRALLFEHPNYRNSTIRQAISRWAPASENNTAAYAAGIAGGTGVTEHTQLSDLTPEQQERFLATMRRIEGWRPGRTDGGHPVVQTTPSHTNAPATPHSAPSASTASAARLAAARTRLARRGDR